MLKFIFASLLVLAASPAFSEIPPTHEIHIESSGYYKKTLELWKAALDTNKLKGSTWFGTLSGNGEKDRLHKNRRRTTIIYKPAWFDSTKKNTEMIFWFHGCGGFGERTFAIRTLGHVPSMKAENFIFVIPEMPWSQNTSTHCKRQSRAWNGTTHEDIKAFYDGVLAVIERLWCVNSDFAHITMIGHSAGGSALANAARSGGLSYIKPDRIVFSDASYGRWADQLWKYYGKQNPHLKLLLFVRKWDKPYRHTVRFLKGLRIRPPNIYLKVFSHKIYTHGRIGDESLSLRRLI